MASHKYLDRRTGQYYDELPDWAVEVSNTPEEYQKEYYSKYGSSSVQPNSGEQLDKADARETEIAKADDRVHKQFGAKSWGEFAGWTGLGAASALGAGYALPWLWNIPGVAQTAAGALNLTGAYEGLNRLTSDEGVSKTYNKFKSGDYEGGAYSLMGDALDASISIPFLNKIKQVTYNAIKPSILKYEFNRIPLKEIKAPIFSDHNRFRIGDLEINDPNLNYRAGGTGIVTDFLQTGKVRSLNFEKPYFNQGFIWRHPSPSIHSKSPGLLVTNESLQPRGIAKGMNINDPLAGVDARRFPYNNDQLNLQNTFAYVWEDGYGFKKVMPGMPKTKYPFSERASTLTELERAGIPKGARNNNSVPDYTKNILSMFPKHDASYIHTELRSQDTKPFAEYLQSVGVNTQKLSDTELRQLIRMRQQSITHPAGEHGIIDTSPWSNYIEMFDGSKNTGDLEFLVNRRTNTLDVSRIHKEENIPGGFSRKSYDIGIDYANRNGMKGIVSGNSLHSPEQTYRVWEHYPTRQTVGNTGHHTFNVGRDVNKIGGAHSISNGPVVLLPTPSTLVLPYKHLSFFHPAMIKNGVLQSPKWNITSPFFSRGGKFKK